MKIKIAVLLVAVFAMGLLEGAIKREFSHFGRYRNVRIMKVTWRGIHFTHSAGGGVFKPEDLNEEEKEILAEELEIWQQKLVKHNKQQKKIAKQLKYEKEDDLKDFVEKVYTLSFNQLDRWFRQKLNIGLYDNGFMDVFEQTYSVADNYQQAREALDLVLGDLEDSLLDTIWKMCRRKNIEETAEFLIQRLNMDIMDYDFKQQFFQRFPQAELRSDFVRYIEKRIFNENPNTAIAGLNKAMKKGKIEAMAKYASLYAHGRGVRQDLSNAIEWYRLAAKRGSLDAKYALGILSAGGEIVENSAKDAIDLFMEAAKEKHPESLFALGNCYLNGFSVEKDYKKAIEFYNLAAEEEYAPAQWALGLCYFWGIGVPERKNNIDTAFKYLQKAAKNRYVPAEFVLGYWLNLNGELENGNEWFCKVYQHNFTVTGFF